MNFITMAFFLTMLAGFSTLLGVMPIFIPIKNEKKVIISCLAFAAGVMICVSITDLIPESISLLGKKYYCIFPYLLSFICLFIGIFVSSYIGDNLSQLEEKGSLYKVGIVSMIAIILHNIPEGIITFISTTKDTSLGISLAIAIALHNIPEGISIGIPIYYASKKKSKALFYTFLSGVSEPFGALLTYLFLLPFINSVILGLLFSFIAGIMIEISMTELLPKSYWYGEDTLTIFFFVMGIVFMLLKFIII